MSMFVNRSLKPEGGLGGNNGQVVVPVVVNQVGDAVENPVPCSDVPLGVHEQQVLSCITPGTYGGPLGTLYNPF